MFINNIESCNRETFDPLEDNKSSIELIDHAGTDLGIANAARVSYGRHNESESACDKTLIEFLLKNKHETPFEQTFLQFNIKAPIFVVRQWMRHRIGVSYNEKSARYTRMDLEFYIPKVTQEQTTCFDETVAFCSKSYHNLLDQGVSKERARCVLPVSLYTNFVFACNLRSLFHFIELRTDSHAQWEIQQYAKTMLVIANKHFPVSVGIWKNLHGLYSE